MNSALAWSRSVEIRQWSIELAGAALSIASVTSGGRSIDAKNVVDNRVGVG